MHELPVTESILEIVLRHAAQADGKQIHQINLVIGELASIVDDSVQFYWDILSKDTAAQGAQLSFQRIPAEMLCLSCQNRFHPDPGGYDCPNCGGINLQITAGREFFVESIEVES
jgi:hydrogenase nickel incorporation protein HypA/HybF